MENKLTPEEIILWLESYRQLMFEIWGKNPELYELYQKMKIADRRAPKSCH